MRVRAEFTGSGGLAGLWADDLSLLLRPSIEVEAGPCQLWLRRRGSTIEPHPLTGPASRSHARDGVVAGTIAPDEDTSLAYRAWFEIVDGGYRWWWEVSNTSGEPVEIDLVCAQDVALTGWDELRRNEYYVSQYLDLTPVETRVGTALAVRQNMPGSGHPWLALASSVGCAGWLTDALQLRHPTGGIDLTRDLPGTRWQHEHTLAALQTPARTLPPGASATGCFVGVVVAAHPDASGPADAALIERAIPDGAARFPASGAGFPDGAGATAAVPTVFDPVRPFPVRDLSSEEVAGLAGDLRLVESGPDGRFWSGFAGDTHVVALAKEQAVLRPHGHVMHLGPTVVAEPTDTTSTAWMAGVFCSQLTRRHASETPAVSLRRGWAGLTEAGGVRIAVRTDRTWRLLTQPSLWLQGPVSCRWIYQGEADVQGEVGVHVTAQVVDGGVDLAVRCDPPADVLVAVGLDAGPLDLTPDFGDDGPLFADGTGRGEPWRCLVSGATSDLGVRLRVPGDGPSGRSPFTWRLPSLNAGHPGVAALDAALTWFAHDAGVHFQAPRGLEQFTGGAWGTRDVCQGPVGLLLAAGEHGALRETLLTVFAAQQDDGDWPQSFDFLPAQAAPGHRESHGDVVYWPLLALGEYLGVTGDMTILDEPVRFVGTDAFTAPAPVREHVHRALRRLSTRRTRDPRLPAYGHGDWNDSLQPARPELADHMCSAWTSVLEIEALRTLADAVASAEPDLAAELRGRAGATLAGVRDVLLVDGELAGYAVLGEETSVDLLVHPRDTTTGLRHGSLQMIHAIAAELLSPEEARAHLELIDAHLAGPSGLFLFDAPVAYSGGEMHVFKRAEAASFWGREIGLMYTHAHLRFVEALTHLGEGQRAWDELARIIPVRSQPVRSQQVGEGSGDRPRQASCYYSSIDAVFTDRYVASQRARDLFDPATPVEGGWRVYSSGPGLTLRLVTERLLGLRFRAHGVEVDPVLPPWWDGLLARVPLPGSGAVEVTYRIARLGHGVAGLRIDDTEVSGTPLTARYRAPGVLVPADRFRDGARVEVIVG